eukprot:g29030.t1
MPCHLADRGHRVSAPKLQLCQPSVQYLGFVLENVATQHFTAARSTSGETDESEHNCLQVIDSVTPPHPDLQSIPMDNPDLVLFTNGSSYRPYDTATLAQYAVITPYELLEAFALPPAPLRKQQNCSHSPMLVFSLR